MSLINLQNNVISIYGEKGSLWLKNLPAVITDLSRLWDLTEVSPVDNMSFHYVAKAIQSSKTPVVMKVGCDPEITSNERRALAAFSAGMVPLLNYQENLNALLLKQGVPGVSLKSWYPQKENEVMKAYVHSMQKMHQSLVTDPQEFQTIQQWLQILDRANDKLPSELLIKAKTQRDQLFASLSKPILLHGDLHLDNLIQDGDEWLIIDPKGVVGEVEFEVAAFDYLPTTELLAEAEAIKLFSARVEKMAELSGLSVERIRQWVFVRLILMAAWQIEDNINPEWAINLANMLGVGL